MTSFFKRIVKGCREPDFLSWPSGQKRPRKVFFGPKHILAHAEELLLRSKRPWPSIGQDSRSVKFSIIFGFHAKFHFSMSFHKGRLVVLKGRGQPAKNFQLWRSKILPTFNLGQYLAKVVLHVRESLSHLPRFVLAQRKAFLDVFDHSAKTKSLVLYSPWRFFWRRMLFSDFWYFWWFSSS